MRALIAGAASALGSRVARLLLSDGHDVSGLTRSNASVLKVAGVEPITGDLLDAQSVQHAVASVKPDVIVQAANALPKAGPRGHADLAATNRLRIEGTANLVAAAREGRGVRYVAESLVVLYGSRRLGAPPVTEEEPVASGLGVMKPAVDALAALERQVLSIDGIALRFGLFYGAGTGSTDALLSTIKRRRLPEFSGADGLMSFVHIDDAAAAVVAALSRGQSGDVYNIVDDEPVTMGSFVRALASQTGAKPPRAVPRWVARLAGRYIASATRANLPVSNAKAKRELGWTPSHPTISL